jgi:hypothetical protein
VREHGSQRYPDGLKLGLRKLIKDGCWQDGAELNRTRFGVGPTDPIFDKLVIDFPHHNEIFKMGMKDFIETGAALNE